MPELPEVETIRRQLEPELLGATIVDSWSFGTPKFADARLAIGSRLSGVNRRGKYLLIEMDGPLVDVEDAAVSDDSYATAGRRELIVHLGMTGQLAVRDRHPSLPQSTSAAGDPDPSDGEFGHLRATWTFDDGRALLFDDVRRFGRIAVVRAGEYSTLPTLATIGPEPFDENFTPEHLRSQVNRSSRFIKTQLLSQRIVAGVGNIYADEALFEARIHPASRRLTKAQAVRLRDAVRSRLKAGIDNGGTTLRNYRDATGGMGQNQDRLLCYGRAGLPCSICGTVLRRIVLDSRATSYCPACQKR